MTRLRYSIAWAFGVCAGLGVACTSSEPEPAEPVSSAPEVAEIAPVVDPVVEQKVLFGISLPASAVERNVTADVGSYSSDDALGSVRNHFRELDIPFRETHYPGGTAFLALDGTNREILVRRSGPRGGVSIDILREGRDTVQALEAAVVAGTPGTAAQGVEGEVRVLNAGYGEVAVNTGAGPTGLEPEEVDGARQAPDVRVVSETSGPEASVPSNQPRVERRVAGVERVNRGTSRNPNVQRPLNFPTVNYEAPRNPNAYY